MTAPGNDEKTHGKHPTQKPVALIERCLLASTNPGDLVLDPFLGGGTTAIAAIRTHRHCVGIELDLSHVELAARRADREIIELLLRTVRIRIEITVYSGTILDCGGKRSATPLSHERTITEPRPSPLRSKAVSPLRSATALQNSPQIDLDLFSNLIDRSHPMADMPQIQTDRIYHETKFVFLSCAHVTEASVIHTTVDVSLQEAWAKTPNGKKRETTHIVRCETEIFRLTN
jgi:hypothetical protein